MQQFAATILRAIRLSNKDRPNPPRQAAAGREVPDDCGLRLIGVCATGRWTLLRRNGCRKKP